MIKTKRNRKWEIPHTILERPTLSFSSCTNCKLKVKLCWVGARERRKRAIFVLHTLWEGNYVNIFVSSQCLAYWIHFQNIHTFVYQKAFLHILLLLVLRIVESLNCILNIIVNYIYTEGSWSLPKDMNLYLFDFKHFRQFFWFFIFTCYKKNQWRQYLQDNNISFFTCNYFR